MTDASLSAELSQGSALAANLQEDIYVFPVSFAQKRLWFMQQLEPDSAAYNVPLALRLKGELNIEVLQASLSAILRRHEILRTVFPVKDGQPVQEIHPAREADLSLVDLSALAEWQRESLAQDLLQQERERPFNLSAAPPLRMQLVRLGEQEHEFLLVMHHIVTDGWSEGILVRELQLLYEAGCYGRRAPLPDLPIQYADYALWQREHLSGSFLEEQLQYWREQLAKLPVLELSRDYARPQKVHTAAETLSFHLDAGLAGKLAELGQQEEATLFMVLLASVQLLLGRYSGQEDVAVGIVIANRNRLEIEGLVGFFANTLVLRMDMAGALNFRELTKRVSAVTVGAYSHAELPFEKLVEELNPDRNAHGTPLVQILLVFQNTPAEDLELPGLQIVQVKTQVKQAAFDLCIAINESAQGLEGTIVYSSEVFARTTIQSLVQHYRRLLRQVSANPDLPLSEISLVSDEEKTQIESWGRMHEHPRMEQCVHHQFEEQAQRTPEAAALICNGNVSTYRVLNEKANHLAHYLRAQGVGPEVRVGLYLAPGEELAIGILAILKAGGVYVPLDPDYPDVRLAYMVEHSSPLLVLTQQRFKEKFPAKEVSTCCLDMEWNNIARESCSNPGVDVQGEALAYVLYTSGSTGIPKGVGVPHMALAEKSRVLGACYRLEAQDRFLQFLSCSFDAFGEEFFPVLTRGAALVIHSGVKSLAPAQMISLIATQGITVLHMPLVYWVELRRQVSEAGLEAIPHVRMLITGGEAIPRKAAFEWVSSCKASLYNAYGPTEATITASVCMLPAYSQDSVAGKQKLRLPIGRPLKYTRAYVLDPEQKLCPIGIAGELYLAGAALARGYQKQPQLTAERFVPDPFGPPGARMYRTGDLSRWNEDGELEYLGRRDQQIKIHGFRIELGEIEAALQQEPAVEACVAMLREDRPGDKRLVAYVVLRQGSALDREELRLRLRGKLPDYMVPGAFVELDKLPVSVNGKVDRDALPKPLYASESGFVAPRTFQEEILASIWQDVLGLERVGVHDNFFELGGHSLLATQVMARIQGSLGANIALVTLFQEPTIALLAERILDSQKDNGVSVPPPVTRRTTQAPVPLTSSQQRLWLLNQLEPGSNAYNAVMMLRLQGQLNKSVLTAALEEIIVRHEVLRTSFPMRDGVPYQEIWPPAPLTLHEFDLTDMPQNLRAARLQELADEHARKPFNLAQKQALRLALYAMGSDEHVLSLAVHHIIFDGWSMPIFLHELSALYAAFLGGQSSPLFELPVQCADVAVWEREWLQGAVLDRHVDYWRELLQGCAQTLDLPTDFPRPAVQSFRGGIQKSAINAGVARQLKQISRRMGVTDFMTLMALINVWLHHYSGQKDILVGTPVSTRHHLETEPLIGFFINTLVFRNQMNPESSFAELLAEVRANALGAYAHQMLPFEKLVDELRVARDAGRNPLFQVMFNMDNDPEMEMEFPGIEIEVLESGLTQSRFDLHLYASAARPQVDLACTYNADLFRASTIESMLAVLGELARLAAERPESRVSELTAQLTRFQLERAIAGKRARASLQTQGLYKIRRRTADSMIEEL